MPDLADLAQVELDLVEVLRKIDGFEKIDLPADRHLCPHRVG